MEYNILRYKSLDSTNTKAKEMAVSAGEGTVIVAEEQRSGRGRQDREWLSPKGQGLWVSLILKPEIDWNHISKVTLIASATVCTVLENMGIGAKIKWPNDIIVADKKVCGILTEVSGNMEGISYMVLGLGLNVNQSLEDFPKDIRQKAGSLKMFTGHDLDLDKILDKLLAQFSKYYLPFKTKGEIDEVLRINRESSVLIGREVYTIDSQGNRKKGLTLDISDKGELIVKYPESIERLSSGQVSVRGMEGYI